MFYIMLMKKFRDRITRELHNTSQSHLQPHHYGYCVMLVNHQENFFMPSSYLDHIISMSEVVFKSDDVDTFQSLDSDVINLCNRKFGLYTVCKESIALGDLKSVSVISEICNSVNSTGLIVSMRNYVFALIPYLKSFYFFKPCNISCSICFPVLRCP